jgi:hypothetical protein
MKDLPGYSIRGSAERIAREYTRHDLMVIAVCCELENRCGLRRDAIAKLVPEIRRAMIGPRSVSDEARLVVVPDLVSVQYIDGPSSVLQGTVLPLEGIFRRVDQYLLGDQLDADDQRNLDLGPMAIPAGRRSNA